MLPFELFQLEDELGCCRATRKRRVSGAIYLAANLGVVSATTAWLARVPIAEHYSVAHATGVLNRVRPFSLYGEISQ